MIQKMKCRELRYRHYTVSAEQMSKHEDGTNLSETTRRLLDALDRPLRRVKEDSVLRCPICKKAVPLEAATTDEDGQGVHEECYLLKLQSKQVAMVQRFSADFETCAIIG